VNYRTPAQVMVLASAMLAAAGIDTKAPQSAREGDVPPTAHRIEPGDFGAVARVVGAELDNLGEGRLAVIAPAAQISDVLAALASSLPAGSLASGSGALDAPVAVLAVNQAKGLEFDAVVLVEPAQILAASARGANDLYVALTRPTQRLRVVHSGPLPAGLEKLDET